MMHNPPQVLARGKHAEVLAWEAGRVAKAYRPGYARSAVEAEFHHACEAHRLGVPTPRPETIVEMQGRWAIVMERVEGPTLFHQVASGAIQPAQAAQAFFDLQAAIHRCAAAAFPPFEARLAVKIRHARGVPEALTARAFAALQSLPGGEALCHGDFHPANVVLAEDGPRVLDWLDAARGPLAADVARSLLLMELARPTQVDGAVRAAFVAAYRERLAAAGIEAAPVQQWRLPHAVARLAEPLDAGERAALLQAISRATAQ